MTVVIRESLIVSRAMAQVPGYESLFLRLGSREQVGLLLLHQCPYPGSWTSPRVWQRSSPGLYSGDFNQLCLGMGSEVAQDFMEAITSMDLPQVIHSSARKRQPKILQFFQSHDLLK